MRIIALDPSLTETGWASFNGGFPRSGVLRPPERPKLRKGQPKPEPVPAHLDPYTGLPRLEWIRREVEMLTAAADMVIIEGYAFSRGDRAHQKGELGGVIRMHLYDRRIPMVEIGPTVLKRFATGKGSAKKEEMLQAAWKRLEYEGANHNEADALFLLYAALVHLDRCPVSFPQAQLAALDGITWPVLERKAVA